MCIRDRMYAAQQGAQTENPTSDQTQTNESADNNNAKTDDVEFEEVK